MILGPFSEDQISQLIEALDQKKVHYVRIGSQLEVADSLVHNIEVELEQMGMFDEKVEELQHEEYLCLQCDFVSSSPGSCPKHGVALLEYSDWVAAQSSQPMDKRVAFVLVLVAAAVVGYYLISHH